MNVLVSINCLNYIEATAYGSVIQAVYRMGRQYPDDNFYLFTPRRMAIATARNEAIKLSLEIGCDYILFIDDDMVVNPDVFKRLLEKDKDMVMALSYIRGYPFQPMVFKWLEAKEMQSTMANVKIKGKGLVFMSRDELLSNIDENGLVRVASVGTPCTLIKTWFLKNMEYPYFWTGLYNTEDVYFCVKAQKTNPDLGIYVDTKTLAGHNLDPEILDDTTIEKLKLYYESLNPELTRTIAQKMEKYSEEIDEKIRELCN